MNTEMMVPLRRTFQAATAQTPEERARLNLDALTSEYMTSYKYVVRRPFPNHPTQKWTSHTFRTKADAELWIDAHKERNGHIAEPFRRLINSLNP